MPLWPFGRKKLRSDNPQTVSPETEKIADTNRFVATNPQNATPRERTALNHKPSQDTPRKRRRSSEGQLQLIDSPKEEQPRQPRTTSREDITALPNARKLQTSPHLRSPASPAIPYSSSPAPQGSRRAMTEPSSPTITQPKRGNPPSRNPSAPQKRRLSKKQEYVDRAVREEEIRAMSAPVPIPKRQGGHGDMLRRDSKKARRTFSKKEHDKRGSNVSLPFPASIRSSMSGLSDQRGWAVSALDVFNPRPAVKVADASANHQTHGSSHGVSRSGSKKEKLPALTQDINRHDRRKIADLADGMDASDIRILMERDQKRREKKKAAEQEKLERSLRKRAEKQKNEDERRAREIGTPPPTALHPAFRSRTEEKKPAMDSPTTIGQTPPTPMSVKGDIDAAEVEKGETYLKYGPEENPFVDPEDSSFADPPLRTIGSRRNRAYSDALSAGSPMQTPMETPMMETPFEDPVVETAQAVRLSQSRMSQIVPSPPQSPTNPTVAGAPMSPLRREYTPDLPAPPRPIKEERSASDISTKRTGTWASFFKRGGVPRAGDEVPFTKSEASFSNTSRESMSRQPVSYTHLTLPTKRIV